MSDYFTYIPLTANTVARAADVNARFQAIEAGFALLPPPIYIYEDRQTFSVDEGAPNAYVANPAIPITAYNTGLHIVLQAANANTGISTLNVSGLGVKEIIRSDGTPLQGGDIVPGQMLDLTYGTSKFQLAMAFADISPAGIAAKIAQAGNIVVNGNLSATSVTCNGQTIDALTAYGVGLVEAPDAVAARAHLGLGTMATQPALAYAPLISPGLQGTPTAPTAAPGTNTTQLATTAFCAALGGLYLPISGGTVTGDVTRGQTIIKSDSILMGNGSYYPFIGFRGASVELGNISGPTDADHAMYFACDNFAFTDDTEVTTYATITNLGVSVPDDIYAAGWNGNLTVPTKNAVYDKMEAALVVSTNALATKANLAGGNTFTGNQTVSGANLSVLDDPYGVAWNGSTNVPTKNAVYDKIEAIIAGGGGVVTFNGRSGTVTLLAADVNSAMSAGGSFGGALSVPDDPYAAGWNGSTNVPTKNAVYDKIEAVIAGAAGVTSWNTRTGAVVLTAADVTTALPALTGDVTSVAGAVATTIAANAVTLAKMADIATARLLGRVTASTGDPEALTGTQATTLLDVFTTSLKGLAPASPGGTTAFLRADGTWNTPPGGGGGAVSSWNTRTGDVVLTSGDVTTALTFTPSNVVHTHAGTDITGAIGAAQMPAYTGDVTSTAGATVNTIAAGVVTYAKMQNSAAGNVVLCRAAAAAGGYGELALAGSRLLGRGSSGDIAAISTDATLGFTGAVLGVQSVPGTLNIKSDGTGGAPPQSYNGFASVTISHNTVGALPLTPREQSAASGATLTPTFLNDICIRTAQAATLAIANWTGTAIPNHGMAIRIKDNGTARAISYGTNYRAIGVTLPTATVVGKTLYLGCIWNATDSKVDVVSVAQE